MQGGCQQRRRLLNSKPHLSTFILEALLEHTIPELVCNVLSVLTVDWCNTFHIWKGGNLIKGKSSNVTNQGKSFQAFRNISKVTYFFCSGKYMLKSSNFSLEWVIHFVLNTYDKRCFSNIYITIFLLECFEWLHLISAPKSSMILPFKLPGIHFVKNKDKFSDLKLHILFRSLVMLLVRSLLGNCY